jgi:hypothetical protein
LRPNDDVNVYHATLQALLKLGTFFQYQEGNYFFDTQEKPNAKVEYRSLRMDPSAALDYALDKWRTILFNDARAVVLRDVAQGRSALSQLEQNNLRFVLSPKRLTPSERTALYHGAENRNQIILLETKADGFNALDNPDIVKWAQRAMSAAELQQSASDVERRRQYERIEREDRQYILDAFRRAGLVFIWIQPGTGLNGELGAELEPLGSAATKDDVVEELRDQIFPRQRFEEHLASRLSQVFGKAVREVESDYKKTLGFPVLTAQATILSAITSLCQARQIGLKHERDIACGRRPELSSNELMDARIVEPFEDPKLTELIHSGSERDTKEKDKGSVDAGDNGDTKQTERKEAEAVQETVQTASTPTPGSLRQAVAAKLVEKGDVRIRQVRFFIFSDQKDIDLSSFPTSLRGTLTGNGDVTVDINIGRKGDYKKADVESMIEMLPTFAGADYKAELKIEVTKPGNQNGRV